MHAMRGEQPAEDLGAAAGLSGLVALDVGAVGFAGGFQTGGGQFAAVGAADHLRMLQNHGAQLVVGEGDHVHHSHQISRMRRR
jgi:hypothetical protein